jgi:hypothetical protein
MKFILHFFEVILDILGTIFFITVTSFVLVIRRAFYQKPEIKKKNKLTSDAELVIRLVGPDRINIEALWIDTHNKLAIEIKIDPDNLSVGALFALVDRGRMAAEIEED